MKRFLLFSFLMSGTVCFGQMNTAILELIDANVQINSNGVLFNNFANSSGGYEATANSGNSAVFNASLWIGGMDPEGHLHVTAITYCQESVPAFCEYFPGPLTADGSVSSTAESALEFGRIWLISRDEVEAHEAYYDCVNDPDCNAETEFPGYTIPLSILQWPAHGDVSAGFAYHLAPFIDADGDGSYQPENGDYPSFPGDNAAYMIWNDNAGPHTDSNGLPLGVEVHTMMYYYLDSNPALSRTIYVHQDIINRSQVDYHDVYFGIRNDFDLGNPVNDYAGTNVEHAFIFAKNGSWDGGSYAGPGYGSTPVRIACKVLAGPYADANGEDDAGPFDGNQEYGNYTKGWNDGIIDNERLGLSSSTYVNNMSGPTGDPVFEEGFYELMKANFSDGTPVTFGGMGYNPTAPIPPTAKYVFPGDSDPYHMGTDFVDPDYPLPGGWTEDNEEHTPGDRRMHVNLGPVSLNAGQKQSIDYVYVFATQTDDPDTDIDSLLVDYVITAAEHPDELPTGVLTSLTSIDKNELRFGLYPNPAKNEVIVSLSGNVPVSYRIYNILGAEVKRGVLNSGETVIDISQLKDGIYLVNVQAGNIVGTQKLVVR